MTPSAVLLEACGVGRRQEKTDQWLLRDISLTVHAGRSMAITGATGSGKTLLLRALARLDRLDAGEVLWKGRPIAGDAVPQFRRQVIYLHQRPALIEGTVEDNLRAPFELRGNADRKYFPQNVLALLKQVDRSETFLHRRSRDLSGGEAQITALLRAIQLQPAVLLLDEPTAALDERSTQIIEQFVRGYLKEASKQRAVVWVSHNQHQVARIADDVTTLSYGRLSTSSGDLKQP